MCSMQLTGIYSLCSDIGYPINLDMNLNTKCEQMLLVSWLENMKIREMEIDDRKMLDDEQNWDVHFSQYLIKLDCPFEWKIDNDLECLFWLISLAANLEYESKATVLSKVERSGDDDISTLAVYCEKLVNSSSILSIPRSSELIVDYIKKIGKEVKYLFTKEKSQVIELDSLLKGWDTGDSLIDSLLVILRVLHLSDLKELQSDINRLIVIGQDYTANPKTNTALGKVGK